MIYILLYLDIHFLVIENLKYFLFIEYSYEYLLAIMIMLVFYFWIANTPRNKNIFLGVWS